LEQTDSGIQCGGARLDPVSLDGDGERRRIGGVGAANRPEDPAAADEATGGRQADNDGGELIAHRRRVAGDQCSGAADAAGDTMMPACLARRSIPRVELKLESRRTSTMSHAVGGATAMRRRGCGFSERIVETP